MIDSGLFTTTFLPASRITSIGNRKAEYLKQIDLKNYGGRRQQRTLPHRLPNGTLISRSSLQCELSDDTFTPSSCVEGHELKAFD